MAHQSLRRRLANRRAHQLFTTTFRGFPYTVGIGRFEDGRLAEVFIDPEKQSTHASDDARDAALALSLALQFGADVEVIRQAVTRDQDGAPAGIIGHALDLITEIDS